MVCVHVSCDTTAVTPSHGASLCHCITHPPVDWVGSCQHTAPRIEASVNPCLRYGDPALLHDLVDGSAVNVTHLTKEGEGGGGWGEGEGGGGWGEGYPDG